MIITSYMATYNGIRGFDITKVFVDEEERIKWEQSQTEYFQIKFQNTRRATLVDVILNSSKRVKDGRDESDILTHTTTELGELALEVQIHEGKSYKEPGPDGIVGEAIDLIVCAVDMIRRHNPDLNEHQLCEIARKKCLKWEEKSK